MHKRIINYIKGITFKRIIHHINGMLWGYPSPCLVMQGLTFTKFGIIYPINSNRSTAMYKEWNVAVKTTQPDVRFEEHAAWMMHIISERGITTAIIAGLEHQQMLDTMKFYKAAPILNHKTIKTS